MAVPRRRRTAGRAGEDRTASHPVHTVVRRLGDAAARVHVRLLWRILRVVLHHGRLLRKGWRRKHRRDGSWLARVVVGRADVPFPFAPNEIEKRTQDGKDGDAAHNAAHNRCYGCWFGRRCWRQRHRGRRASRRRPRRRRARCRCCCQCPCRWVLVDNQFPSDAPVTADPRNVYIIAKGNRRAEPQGAF